MYVLDMPALLCLAASQHGKLLSMSRCRPCATVSTKRGFLLKGLDACRFDQQEGCLSCTTASSLLRTSTSVAPFKLASVPDALYSFMLRKSFLTLPDRSELTRRALF